MLAHLSRSGIVFIIIPLLFGAGCRSAAMPAAQTPAAPSSNTPYIPPSEPPKILDPRTELRNAIVAFTQVKSFRTKVRVSSSQGEMKAVLEFNKPNRFRGTVELGKSETAEIIVVDTSLYMRVNQQQWLNLSKTSSAKTIGDTLKNALNGDSNLEAIGLDESTPVTKAFNAERGCDMYETSVKSLDGKTNPVHVCVRDGLPKYLDLTTPQGPVYLEYYDYNALFLIEKPL